MAELGIVYAATRLLPIPNRKGIVSVWVEGQEEIRENWPDGPVTLGPALTIGRLDRAKLERPRGDLVHVDQEAWVRMTPAMIAEALKLDGSKADGSPPPRTREEIEEGWRMADKGFGRERDE